MSRSSRRAAFSATLCAGLAHGLALSDFSPALTNVPDPCGSVYMQQIAGCSRSDFSRESRCSQACISGLVAVNKAINQACQDFSAPSGSLISFFQHGEGIQLLCNVEVVTSSTSTSVPPVGQGTMTLPSTSAKSVSSIIVDTSSAPSPSPSLPTTTTTQTGIITATGKPTRSSTVSTASITTTTPSPATTATTTSAIPTPSTTSSTAAAQSEPDGNVSAGGDPFSPSGAGTALMPHRLTPFIGLVLGLLLRR